MSLKDNKKLKLEKRIELLSSFFSESRREFSLHKHIIGRLIAELDFASKHYPDRNIAYNLKHNSDFQTHVKYVSHGIGYEGENAYRLDTPSSHYPYVPSEFGFSENEIDYMAGLIDKYMAGVPKIQDK